MWIIEYLKNKTLNILFPLKCFLCGKNGDGICVDCLETLKRAVETPHPDTYSYFSYKDPRVRKILQNIKYFRKLYLIEALVKHISKDFWLNNLLGNKEFSVLVPIPMSSRRIWSRGGNHTFHMARIFSSSLNIPVSNNLLARKKDTLQQVLTHSRSERLKNMRGAFSINEKILPLFQNKRIILVDDVSTTGATIAEARKILEKNGFRNIIAITLAH